MNSVDLAYFRFYAELNDLLPPNRRQVSFAHHFKDRITWTIFLGYDSVNSAFSLHPSSFLLALEARTHLHHRDYLPYWSLYLVWNPTNPFCPLG